MPLALYIYIVLMIFQVALLFQGVAIYVQERVGSVYPVFYYIPPLFVATTMLPVSILIRQRFAPVFRRSSESRLWLRLSIPSALTVVAMLYYYNNLIYSTKSIDRWVLIVYIAVMTSLIITNMMSMSIITSTVNADQMAEKLVMADKLIEMQKSHYRMLGENIEAARKARHDMRHQLAVIERLMGDDSPQDLKDTVSEFKSSLPRQIETVFCDNYSVNCIIDQYYELSLENGIEFDARLAVSEFPTASDLELAVLFGNCLENAYEAALLVTDGPRYIRVRGTATGSMLNVSVTNSFSGPLKKKDGAYLSHKRGYREAGLGIASIEHIAESHNGAVSVKTTDDRFTMNILLCS